MRVKVEQAGEKELWTEQNGHLSRAKPRPNSKVCSAQEMKE
jgi:hypothetical protein